MPDKRTVASIAEVEAALAELYGTVKLDRVDLVAWFYVKVGNETRRCMHSFTARERSDEG